MNKLIEIMPTVFSVIVPGDAYDFEFIHDKTRIGYKVDYRLFKIDLPKGEFKIHGTCILPKLEFDFEVAESWVESKWFIRIRFYKDYIKSKNNAITKEDSFQTRIQKAIYDAGLLLINPIDIKGQTFSNEHQNKWQESESKVIRGKLLIIEKI